MKRIILFALVFSAFALTAAPCLWAAEFGALITGEYDAGETEQFGSVILAPWISMPFTGSELYVCAGLNMSFGDKFICAPEIFRLDFSSALTLDNALLSLRIGRFNWQDTSGFTAKGSFDGAELIVSTGKIRLGINGLYTGFLFKDTSDINTSPADTKDYSAHFDPADFGNTYFAPRRLVTSLFGEFPGLPFGRGLLYASVMAQFDCSGAQERFHTQYLLLRHTLIHKAFDLELAGAAELENTESDGIRPAFAVSAEAGFQFPSAITDRFSLGCAWASGEGSATGAFFPITREAGGFVLKPAFSGIMHIKAHYKARFLPSLLAELGGIYFLRTDSVSFIAPNLESDSYLLGMELDAGLLWVPFSDLSISARGGVFLPETGSAWADNTPVSWHLVLGMIFSF